MIIVSKDKGFKERCEYYECHWGSKIQVMKELPVGASKKAKSAQKAQPQKKSQPAKKTQPQKKAQPAQNKSRKVSGRNIGKSFQEGKEKSAKALDA